ncbi:MAG TPA: hypothetical protein VHD35_12920 [Chitinophagaceae bacterium]|nr:hypothetical protein [Chitinophagaceae bacterium]
MLRLSGERFTALQALAIANCRPALNDAAILAWSNSGQINATVLGHLKSYLQFRPAPVFGPYEIHPYIFRETSQFNLNRKYLLLGTFPPNTYLHNIPKLAQLSAVHPNVKTPPTVDFYYGNMASLWKFFGLAGPMTRNSIIAFLTANSISISDSILGAQRRKFVSSADQNLYNILPHQGLCKIFDPESLIETILFTSGSLKEIKINNSGAISFTSPNTLNIFLGILMRCNNTQKNGIEISGQPNGLGSFYKFDKMGLKQAINDQNKHIIWWLRLKNRKLRIINLPTPAIGLGMISPKTFFGRWVGWKANQNGLPTPGVNLKDYMNQYANAFFPPYTNQYRKEIYDLAIHNIPVLQAI